MATEQPSDNDLIELVKLGDQQAYAELVHRHSGMCYAIGLRMLRNPQDARDVVQEAFMNAYRRIDSFRGDAAFSTWLARITTNSALMKLRSRRRRPEVPLAIRGPEFDDDGSHEHQVVDWSPLADKMMSDHELGRRIRQAVDDLPEGHRAVLILADYQHMSMKDIADTLDLTVANTKTRLHRARLAVRESLNDYLESRD